MLLYMKLYALWNGAVMKLYTPLKAPLIAPPISLIAPLTLLTKLVAACTPL